MVNSLENLYDFKVYIIERLFTNAEFEERSVIMLAFDEDMQYNIAHLSEKEANTVEQMKRMLDENLSDSIVDDYIMQYKKKETDVLLCSILKRVIRPFADYIKSMMFYYICDYIDKCADTNSDTNSTEKGSTAQAD